MTSHNPWLGLASYEETKGAENDYKFCGRDEETLDVVRLIDNNLFITLYGSSGIGKTSLLRAGVIPILRKKDYFPLYVRLSQETKEISYAAAIVQKLQNSSLTQESGATTKHPEGNDRLYLWNYFATTRFYNEGREVYPVIILDQFEEVFREGDKAKAELLLKQIYLLLNDELEMPDEAGYSADTNYRFVASIREDFLFVLEDSIDANSLDLYKNNRYRLRPMKPENAREVVLIPGKDCIEENEKEAIAERIISLATRPQSDAIDTLLLSLVCAGTYDKKAGQKIALDDLSIWKNNPMEVYYQETVKGLSADQVRYIQQHLIREDGSRKRIDSKEVKTALGENTYQQLTLGKNRLFALGDKGQVELLHDQLGMAIYEERKTFEEREKKKKFRRRISVIGIIVLAIAVIFWFQNAKLKQQRWKMLENQARFVSEKAEPLVIKDPCLAKLLAINVLPNDLKHPNKPYVLEAERVLRDASFNNTIVLKDNGQSNIDIFNYQFTTDAKRILSSSKDGIRIWDMEEGSCIRFIPYNNYNKLWIINPDQGIAALEEDSVIKLIDIESGAEIKEIKTSLPYTFINKILCCQDGSKIAAIVLRGLSQIIDIESGIAKSEFKGGYDNTFSPDGNLIISINYISKKVEEIWDSKYFDGVFLRDSLNNYTTRMGDSEIRLIDVETGTIVKKIKTSTNLRKVRCSPDGSTIAALDYDGLIHIIDLGTGIEKSVYQGGYYYDFSPDSKSLAYFDQKNGVLRIRNIKNGSIIFINEMKFLNYVREEYVVNSVRFSPDGKYIIILTGDNLNYVITIKEPYCFAIDGTNSEKTIHNSFSYNGKYFVSAKDKDVMVWDAETKQCMRVLKGHKEDVYSVAISPNGEFVVSTDKTSMLLWNVNEGVCMKEIDIPNLCAVFSPDSKEIILIQMDLVNQENYIDIIDVETGEIIRRINDDRLALPQYASFSPDGKKLACTSAMPWFNVVDMENNSVTPLGKEYDAHYRSVEFSPDGKHIVSISGYNIQIWDVEEGKRIQVLKGHTSSVNHAEFSPDDKYIVSSCFDNTIRVWDIKTGVCIHVIHLKDSACGCIFNPNGKQIISQVSDSLLFFDFPPLQDLIDQTRERFKDRPLTPEERRMYYLE